MAEEGSVNQGAKSSLASPPSNISEADVNPNQRLCSIVLNEFNYLPLSRVVTLALGGMAKLAFIDGVVQTPEATSPNCDTLLCKDQLVMSWLLNLMERKIVEIFSYSDSSEHIWEKVEMYGNQNSAARIFHLKRDVVTLQQKSKSSVQHLGDLTTTWNELDIYRPHTTDAPLLLKRVVEDKIFQLLASLSPEYKDLISHVLMSFELPSFSNVCATIQSEEDRRCVMNMDTKATMQVSSLLIKPQFGEPMVLQGKTAKFEI